MEVQLSGRGMCPDEGAVQHDIGIVAVARDDELIVPRSSMKGAAKVREGYHHVIAVAAQITDLKRLTGSAVEHLPFRQPVECAHDGVRAVVVHNRESSEAA